MNMQVKGSDCPTYISRPQIRPSLNEMNLDFTATPSRESQINRTITPNLNVTLSAISPLLEKAAPGERSKAVDDFVTTAVTFVGEAWERSDREGEEDLSRVEQAISITKSIDEILETQDPEQIAMKIREIYSAPDVLAYKRELFLKAMIKYINARLNELESDADPQKGQLAELCEALIGEEVLEYTIEVAIKNTTEVFDALAKTDSLHSAIREQLSKTSSSEIPHLEQVMEEISALDDNKLHGIAASIIWEIKESLIDLTAISFYHENIHDVMNSMAASIVSERSEQLSPLALRLIVKAVYTLIEAGPDSVRDIPNTKGINFNSYSMKALNMFVSTHPLTESVVAGNVQTLRQRLELKRTEKVNLVTLLKQKIRTKLEADESLGRKINNGYRRALEAQDVDLDKAISGFLDSIYRSMEGSVLSIDANDHEILEYILDDVRLNYSFNRYDADFASALLLEVMKVVVCDGRIFTENAIPEEEKFKYNPRLQALEKAFIIVFAKEA
jgi:hypothetical protein